MSVLILVGVAIILLFGAPLIFGAPYLPTLSKKVEEALDLLNLKPGETLLELGSGDGKILVAAAKRGINSVGYEINPVLVIVTRVRTWRYRNLVTVKLGNFWSAKWPDSDGMYVFLLQNKMSKLDKKIVQYPKRKSYKLVSFGFKIEGKKPQRTVSGLSLYVY